MSHKTLKKKYLPYGVVSKLLALKRLDCNKKCADCSQVFPNWCSVGFGVWICMRCATAHRNVVDCSLSRVKSPTVDTWNAEMLEEFTRQTNGRNDVANFIYEFQLGDGISDKSLAISKKREHSSTKTDARKVAALFARRRAHIGKAKVARAVAQRKANEGSDAKTRNLFVADKYVRQLWTSKRLQKMVFQLQETDGLMQELFSQIELRLAKEDSESESSSVSLTDTLSTKKRSSEESDSFESAESESISESESDSGGLMEATKLKSVKRLKSAVARSKRISAMSAKSAQMKKTLKLKRPKSVKRKSVSKKKKKKKKKQSSETKATIGLSATMEEPTAVEENGGSSIVDDIPTHSFDDWDNDEEKHDDFTFWKKTDASFSDDLDLVTDMLGIEKLEPGESDDKRQGALATTAASSKPLVKGTLPVESETEAEVSRDSIQIMRRVSDERRQQQKDNILSRFGDYQRPQLQYLGYDRRMRFLPPMQQCSMRRVPMPPSPAYQTQDYYPPIVGTPVAGTQPHWVGSPALQPQYPYAAVAPAEEPEHAIDNPFL